MRVGVTAGLALGLAVLAALPAGAQDAIADRPSIVVSGVAKVERAPELFRVNVDLEGLGTDQVSALRAVAQVQSRVTQQLAALAGAERMTLTTSEVQVGPRHDPDCSDMMAQGCAIIGYSASIQLKVEGSPARLAGNVVSAASEAGATRARLTGFALADYAAARIEADHQAFESARRQATALAAASGQRLGRILRIQEPGTAVAVAIRSEDVLALPTGRDYQSYAEVEISTTPAPIEVTSRLSVVFEVE